MTSHAVSSPTRQEIYFQRLKWLIYTLLIVNFFYYVVEEWSVAQHTLSNGGGVNDWLSAFATSLDDLSWIILIAIFEIETYWLEEDFSSRFWNFVMQLGKLICYLTILRTTYTYIGNLSDLYNIVQIQGVSDLCAIANLDYSFSRNLAYYSITPETCTSIFHTGDLFIITKDATVFDTAGLAEEFTLRRIDLLENVSWLIVVALIELTVRLQNRGYHEGPTIDWANRIKFSGYCVIAGAAVFWFTKGHYVYAWDEFVWIAGFAALDVNLSEWRHDLEAEELQAEQAARSSARRS